jgi:hypothetical protein
MILLQMPLIVTGESQHFSSWLLSTVRLAWRRSAGSFRPDSASWAVRVSLRIVISNVKRSPEADSSRNCTPGYSPCLPPAYDYDCRGGSGDGPKYSGPVRVTGCYPYDLDRDGDGKACEWS